MKYNSRKTNGDRDELSSNAVSTSERVRLRRRRVGSLTEKSSLKHPTGELE